MSWTHKVGEHLLVGQALALVRELAPQELQNLREMTLAYQGRRGRVLHLLVRLYLRVGERLRSIPRASRKQLINLRVEICHSFGRAPGTTSCNLRIRCRLLAHDTRDLRRGRSRKGSASGMRLVWVGRANRRKHEAQLIHEQRTCQAKRAGAMNQHEQNKQRTSWNMLLRILEVPDETKQSKQQEHSLNGKALTMLNSMWN